MSTAIVLSGDGINCSNETAFALEQAGFKTVISHTSDLLAEPKQLSNAQLLALPGGFSFGDEIASGKVLAVKIRHKMLAILQEYIEKGGLVLGICNGFQTLVQLGLLPHSEEGSEPLVSLTHNSGGRFINRWVEMECDSSNPFFKGLEKITLPIRHGEGRIQLKAGATEADRANVKERGPLTYCDDVNGSFEKIAALSNVKGNVLGLMPHPEAFIRHSQHPNSNSLNQKQEQKKLPDGLVILKNAYSLI